MAPGSKIQASKLSPILTEEKLRGLLELIAPIENLVLIPSPFGGGYEALVDFKDPDAADVAVLLTGTLFFGLPLNITKMDVPTTPLRPFVGTALQPLTQQQMSPGGTAGGLPSPQAVAAATGGRGISFQPLYNSPHMTLYNLNTIPQQYQQRNLDQSTIDLSKVDSKTVYVGNLPITATKEQLEEVFKDCGKITRVNIAGRPNHPTRFAFMDFETLEGAKLALSSSSKMLGDRHLRVNLPRHTQTFAFAVPPAPSPAASSSTSSQPSSSPIMDIVRSRQRNVVKALVSRGGDPALLKKLEESEGVATAAAATTAAAVPADATLSTASSDASSQLSPTGLTPALGALSTAKVDQNGSGGPETTSVAETKGSGVHRPSRSRSPDRDYHRRSGSRSRSRRYHDDPRGRSRSGSRSPSRYTRYSSSRSSRYDDEHMRYGRGRSRSRSRGYSRERERERDRYRDGGYHHDSRDRERERERSERERDRDRDRDRASGSHRSSRDRERERERDRHREHDRGDRDRGERERERDRGGDRERDRERERDRHRSTTADRDRERERDRDRPRDKDKEKDKVKEKGSKEDRSKESGERRSSKSSSSSTSVKTASEQLNGGAAADGSVNVNGHHAKGDSQ